MRLAIASWFVFAAAVAHADDEPHQSEKAATQALAPAELLAGEQDSIDRALATVTDKLAAADRARQHRLRAAYRLLESHASADPLAAARGRAAARLLLERDTAERALLADEATRLRAARARTVADAQHLPSVALPQDLARPARGSIARHAGTIEHERSKATLARRGLDFDVDERAPASAPAAGTVRYAGPIRGLDNGVVLDCGDYYAIVGKLGDLAVPAGATVARGDRLGRAARHRVYLEIRIKVGPGGLPIDPEPLLAK